MRLLWVWADWIVVAGGSVRRLGWNGRQKSHLERVFYERLVFVISSEGNGKP